MCGIPIQMSCPVANTGSSYDPAAPSSIPQQFTAGLPQRSGWRAKKKTQFQSRSSGVQKLATVVPQSRTVGFTKFRFPLTELEAVAGIATDEKVSQPILKKNMQVSQMNIPRKTHGHRPCHVFCFSLRTFLHISQINIVVLPKGRLFHRHLF